MRAIDPNGAFGDDYDDWVPDWSDLTFSMIRDGSGSLGFTVPVDGDGVARALALQVVVLLFDGAEPRNGRFIRRNRSTGLIAPAEVTSDLDWKSLTDALRDAQFRSPAGEMTRSWTNARPGDIMNEVLSGPIARTALKWWGYRGVTYTGTKDSNGVTWPATVTVEFSYGQSVYEILDWMRQYGYIEFGTDRGKLEMWVPSSRGVNRADAGNIVLWAGEHFRDAPEEETFDDYCTDVTVIGDHPTVDTSVIYVHRTTGSYPYGVRERSIRVNGVSNTTTLAQIGDKFLAAYKAPRNSRTYAITGPGYTKWRPGIAYEPGDTIAFAVGSDANNPLVGKDPLTDTQRLESVHIISGEFSNRTNGNIMITVNDWLDDRDNRLQQLLDRYAGN
jgi:hypothetical protein